MKTVLNLARRLVDLYTVAAPQILPFMVAGVVFGSVSAVSMGVGLALMIGYNVGSRRLPELPA